MTKNYSGTKDSLEALRPLLPIMRCPYGGEPVTLGEDGLVAGTRSYAVMNGIPDLVDPQQVAPIDDLFQEQYGEKTARSYDKTLRLMSLLLGCWEPGQRQRLVRLLNPPQGGRMLEVAVGTGANLPPLAQAVGPEGTLVGVDLSLPMMGVAQSRTNIPTPVHLIRADGCRLPFKDDSFDAVFHFGGINMFGDVKQGIAEMLRVAKPGSPILISDEGMSEGFRRRWLGRQLARMNSLNLCRAPFHELPWDDIHRFELHWAWRELFYVLLFRKGPEPDRALGTTAKDEVERRLIR